MKEISTVARKRQKTQRDAPTGMQFFDLVWSAQDELEALTDNNLPEMGKRAPACLANIGTALSLLDRMASCWWGCPGGDHLVEYLCGRVACTANAALRLTRLGFYDEALLLCRSVGEVANMFFLFRLDPAAFSEWKEAKRTERMREFGPAPVRRRLEKLDAKPPVDHERYRLLSERAAHVHPETKPQSFNLLEIPLAAPLFQQEGVLVCLNELARPLVFSMAFGAGLLNLDGAVRAEVNDAARMLAEQIGGATITEMQAFRAFAFDDEETREKVQRLAEELATSQGTDRPPKRTSTES